MADDNGFGAYWQSAFGPNAIAPGPVTQAPTNAYLAAGGQGGTNGQNLAKKNGPWDKFRAAAPADVDPVWWNAFLDTQNYTYEQGTTADKDKVNAYVGSSSPEQVATLAKGMSLAQLQNKSGGFAPATTYQQAPRAPGPGTVGSGASAAFDPVSGATKLNADTQAAIKAGKAQDAETWKGVQPSIDAVTTARDNQVAGDRQAESDLGAAGQKYVSDLAATQSQRVAGAASANATQTGLFNTLQAQNLANNNLLTSANNTLQGELGGQSTQASGVAAQLSQQLSGLNSEDRAAYLSYLGKTDPLLAKMVAQASDPKYVQQQQDVYNQYKAQSTPEVSAQERYLAELARRKTENDDKSSRDAVDQDLATRGLRSGGQVIAGQYANRQNTAQDRVQAELGLQASAVGRAQTNLAGAADVAGQLRNADDAMKNFSDQYAQNDAVRRGNVALQQNQQGLATTKQVGDRDQSSADFQRGVINDNTFRSGQKFQGTAQTTSANSGRDQSTYNAGTQTTGANWDRDSSTWSAADANAGVGYDTVGKDTAFKAGNLAGEVGSASNAAGTVMTAAQIKMLKDQGWTDAEIQALKQVYGNQVAGGVQAPSAAASNN